MSELSVDGKIVNALKNIAPTSAWVQNDDDSAIVTECYFVFNYSTNPVTFGNNQVPYEKYLCQIHLFTPVDFNPIQMKKAAKKALREAGFTYPSEVPVSKDKTGQHYCLECSIVEGTGDYGDD